MTNVLNKQNFCNVYAAFEKAFTHALRLLSPEKSVQAALKIDGNILKVRQHTYALKQQSPIHIIAFGKAAASMIVGAQTTLGNAIAGGIASVPMGTVIPESPKIDYFPGALNNLPDANAAATTVRIENYLKRLSEDDIVLFLVSGGGSALLPAPIEGLTIEEKQALIKVLASNGATIQELNTVRIALSRVKGGKLAKLVKGKSIALIISDIIDDPIELIASGPTVVPAKRTEKHVESAVEIAKRLLGTKLDQKILSLLEKEKKDVPTTRLPVQNEIVASNGIFVTALVEQLKAIDSSIHATIQSTNFTGNATSAATTFFNHGVDAIRTAPPNDNPKWCFEIFAGETTVTFPKTAIPVEAKGGRNQEMVLAFLHRLAIAKQDNNFNANIGLIAVGTDGQDGPTDAAGAFISSTDFEAMSYTQIDSVLKEAEEKLSTKNSYAFWNTFNAGKNHIRFGKTGHNLMDVYVLAYMI